MRTLVCNSRCATDDVQRLCVKDFVFEDRKDATPKAWLLEVNAGRHLEYGLRTTTVTAFSERPAPNFGEVLT